MSRPDVISIQNVSKRFVIRKEKSLKERVVNLRRSNLHKEDFWALRDVSFDIEAGSTVGLIGPNGSGKSTLLKTVGGIIQPTTGSVMLRGRLAALLELGAGFHPDLTGRENIYLNASILGLSRQETERHFDAIVDFSGIERFIDTQVKFYSSGMYVRLAFAVAIHVDPDVLLVDEVLAVGDEAFQRKCMDRIRAFQHEGRTIVLVTHSLNQVLEVCDRAVVLDHGTVIADGAPRDSLRALREEYDQMRQDDVAHELERAAQAQAEAEAEQAAVTLAPPTPTAEVVSLAVHASDGSPTEVLRPGEGIRVRVTVHADAPVVNGYVGIAMEDTAGNLLYGTNSKLLGISIPTVIGTQTFEFDLPSLWIGDTSLVLHAAISAENGIELHRLREGALLSSVTDDSSIGIVWTKPTFSVTSA
ncbi:ABC transporter ATP-binding protein [Cellulomonas hominis]|uniref:ABC-2 type transport system ATP-binding protein n=1 Tax=Cellulomonas hominis TaxID=156981 RepID=A0A511F7G7_9CELL|nr:ABC transporter ATP-binding protein [Cellulomonas hominis]MBB5474005.1 ABC-2 type transport system ATP-binding protein [Cellulomonas hominis]MBU5424026.1 ABC transporter ATP-binding protein [Cellulomonas hominis]NKY07051.1 ABC transporter ATP-binding protein [Cellulomonas hominis]GEL45200.1 hypothetical protein CHO01_03160 [Cellulomonas hominis]